MSLCEMNPHQVATYISLWTVAITALVTSVGSVLLYRITTGLLREGVAYQRGYDDAVRSHAPRLDRDLHLGLSDYDAQRPNDRTQEVNRPPMD